MAYNALPWSNLSQYYYLSQEDFRKDGNFKAKCLVCIKNKYISTSTTSSSNLRKHLKFVHPTLTIQPLRNARRKRDTLKTCSSTNGPDWPQPCTYYQELYQASKPIQPVHLPVDDNQMEPCLAQCVDYEKFSMDLQPPCEQRLLDPQSQQEFKMDYDNLDEIFSSLPLDDIFQLLQAESLAGLNADSASSSISNLAQSQVMSAQRTQYFPQCTDYRVLDISQQQQLQCWDVVTGGSCETVVPVMNTYSPEGYSAVSPHREENITWNNQHVPLGTRVGCSRNYNEE